MNKHTLRFTRIPSMHSILHRSVLTQAVGLLTLICAPTSAIAAVSVVYDFNAGDGGFVSTLNTAAFDGPWVYLAGSGSWGTEGQQPEIGHPCTTDLTSPSTILDSPGKLVLSIDHRWAMEPGWDGGGVFVSINGGAFSQVPEGSFTSNGYSGAVLPNSASQLAGQPAFVETSAAHGAGTFLTSVANLGPYNSGDSIRVSFRAAYDTNTTGGSPDWEITSVSLASDQSQSVPDAGGGLVLFALGLGAVGAVRRQMVKRH